MVKSFRKPVTLLEMLNFQQTLAEYLPAKGLEWGVAQADIDTIVALCTLYLEKAQAAQNPGTQSPSQTVARKNAWANLWDAASWFYREHLLYNKAISSEDQNTLGIKVVEAGSRSPIPAPTEFPVIKLDSSNPAALGVRFQQQDTTDRRKPYGVAHCQVVMKVGGEAPESIEDCPRQYNITTQGEQINFALNQRGQMVYVYARWVNRNGKVGPWTQLITAIIP